MARRGELPRVVTYQSLRFQGEIAFCTLQRPPLVTWRRSVTPFGDAVANGDTAAISDVAPVGDGARQ